MKRLKWSYLYTWLQNDTDAMVCSGRHLACTDWPMLYRMNREDGSLLASNGSKQSQGHIFNFFGKSNQTHFLIFPVRICKCSKCQKQKKKIWIGQDRGGMQLGMTTPVPIESCRILAILNPNCEELEQDWYTFREKHILWELNPGVKELGL